MCSEHLWGASHRFLLGFHFYLTQNCSLISKDFLVYRLFWKYIVWFLNVWELCSISLLLVSDLVPRSFRSFSLYSLFPGSASALFWETLRPLCCWGSKCSGMLSSVQVPLLCLRSTCYLVRGEVWSLYLSLSVISDGFCFTHLCLWRYVHAYLGLFHL